MRTNTTGNKYVARAVPAFASVSAFVIACAFTPLLPISAGMLAALGGVAAITSIEYIASHFYRTKLDHYFEQANMSNKTGQLPEVVSVEQTDSGTRYEIRFPAGLSVSDLERDQSAIEQFIGKDIIVSKTGASGFINCLERKLLSNYEYEFIHTDKPLEIVLGFGFSGLRADAYYEVWKNGEAAPYFLEVQLSPRFDQQKYESAYYLGAWRERWQEFPPVVILSNRRIHLQRGAVKYIPVAINE